MPTLPDGGAAQTGNASTTTTTAKPGDVAVQLGATKLNAPYVYGAKGPDSFDCSGFVYWSYLNGPHIDVGGDTDAMWSSTNTQVMYDGQTGTGPMSTLAGGTPAPDPGQLEVGDILLFGQPGASGPRAHAQMYYGGGKVIEATGDHVQINTVNLTGVGSAFPLRGIKRASGGGGTSPPAAGGGASSGQGSGNQDTTAAAFKAEREQLAPIMQNLKDPRNNLPFSSYFQSQQILNGSGAPPTGGGWGFQVPGQAGLVMPVNLVRGGMAELLTKEFSFYFMMNPLEISVGVNIDTGNLSPQQQDPNFAQSGGYWVSTQTISFRIYMNRMYEVWQGNVPGPSDLGVRWDTRALERLVGLFDAIADGGNAIGLGNNGWGSSPALTIPLQIVFGGPNSIQFQGLLSQLDYTFTIFDANMIPVEGYADIEIMRQYTPGMSSLPLTQALVNQSGQVGVQPGIQVSGPANGGALIKVGQPQ
jgi:cell wall-associated NlpC family hydrolase